MLTCDEQLGVNENGHIKGYVRFFVLTFILAMLTGFNAYFGTQPCSIYQSSALTNFSLTAEPGQSLTEAFQPQQLVQLFYQISP